MQWKNQNWLIKFAKFTLFFRKSKPQKKFDVRFLRKSSEIKGKPGKIKRNHGKPRTIRRIRKND